MHTALNQKPILEMADLAKIEISAITSHSRLPAIPADQIDPRIEPMTIETMSVLDAMPQILPKLFTRESFLAETNRIKSLVKDVGARLQYVEDEHKREFLSFIQFSGLDLHTIFHALQEQFGRKHLALLDLGGGAGELVLSIEKCVPDIQGFVIESTFTSTVLESTDHCHVPDNRIVNGDMFNLQQCVPQHSADIIISRNTIGICAIPDKRLIDSIHWALRPGGCFIIDLNVFNGKHMKNRILEAVSPENATRNGGAWNYLDLSWHILENLKSRMMMFGSKEQSV